MSPVVTGLWTINKTFISPIRERLFCLKWTKEAKKGFEHLTIELMKAPALGIPDITKPFGLYSYEKHGMALGVLAQTLGLYI